MSVPRVDLTPQQLFCAKHLEPFRAEWPRGYGIAVVRMFDAIVRSESFQAKLLEQPNGTAADGKFNVEAIGPTLSEFGPACCAFLSESDLETVYADAGVREPKP